MATGRGLLLAPSTRAVALPFRHAAVARTALLAVAATSRTATIPAPHLRAFTSGPDGGSSSGYGAPSPLIPHYQAPSGGGGSLPSYFQRPSLPANTIVRFVPQQTAWIVERMGKFNRILQPGLAILIPFLDRIAYVKSLKEVALEIPSQSAITADNVTLELDGVLYTRVFDAYKASYGVEDAEYAISQLAQTTMRSEIGQLTLDHVLKERAALNTNITAAINEAAQAWGVTATAEGIDAVARSIAEGRDAAQGAVSLSVAEKYVDAFGRLAKEGTAVVVPGNVGDIGGMIATALSVYGKVGDAQAKTMASGVVKGAASAADEAAAAGSAKTESPADHNRSMRDSIVADFDRATETQR
ncbi:erythrocyte band 7 integral membrane protein [Magnaporthiopsis poae ATCC 64411]|uniref:Erythrocyte band 7 integral membrane protein n=1 Tax=Magnaporthiopsis poae (strain ATCC 64411 / 73-15) TaxID=644358 RepID=A0A0C4E448_MAGP6|nr:erythrocyte band 7 integral membrane protein [Magnaporthiopsis poae ATCC 64411]